jgi:hypothetical protein
MTVADRWRRVALNPATFMLACDLLGVDPFEVRKALRL